MIEFAKKTTKGTNTFFAFPDTQPRVLVLSNGHATDPAYVRLQRDEGTINSTNFDLVIGPLQTVTLESISVYIVSVATTSPLGVFRYI